MSIALLDGDTRSRDEFGAMAHAAFDRTFFFAPRANFGVFVDDFAPLEASVFGQPNTTITTFNGLNCWQNVSSGEVKFKQRVVGYPQMNFSAGLPLQSTVGAGNVIFGFEQSDAGIPGAGFNFKLTATDFLIGYNASPTQGNFNTTVSILASLPANYATATNVYRIIVREDAVRWYVGATLVFTLPLTTLRGLDVCGSYVPFLSHSGPFPGGTVTSYVRNFSTFATRRLANGLAQGPSTIVGLTGNAVFTSAQFDAIGYSRITGTVLADQAGTLNIDWSSDGVNYDVTTTQAVVAGTGASFSAEVIAPFARVRYVNGAVAQGTFRLYSFLRRI